MCFSRVLDEFTHFFSFLEFQLLFARGDLVELLISSNISRYAEFRAVDRIITCIANDMKVVPCSRADVFTNKNVTVLEKRLLMKALSSCLNENNDEEFKGIAHLLLFPLGLKSIERIISIFLCRF